MRVIHHAQRGAALLSFAIFLGVIVMGAITAMSSGILRKQQATLELRQRAYVDDIMARVEMFYETNAGQLDRDSTWANFSENNFKAAALDQQRFNVELKLSNRLTAPDNTVKYRRVLVYLPTDTDATNPPDLSSFETTGTFHSCSDPSLPCDKRVFAIYDAMDLQKRNYADTVRRMQQIALNAQSYFKARVLQDPERNAAINYFMPPSGCASAHPNDIPCLPLAGGGFVNLDYAGVEGPLALSPAMYLNAWGTPIQVTNMAPHAETAMPPYSLVIRTQSPWGGFLSVYATQAL